MLEPIEKNDKISYKKIESKKEIQRYISQYVKRETMILRHDFQKKKKKLKPEEKALVKKSILYIPTKKALKKKKKQNGKYSKSLTSRSEGQESITKGGGILKYQKNLVL